MDDRAESHMNETEILYPGGNDLEGLRQMMDGQLTLQTITRQLAIYCPDP